MVLCEEETIVPDTLALVGPQASQSNIILLVNGWLSEQEVLDNLGEVPHVELVVELQSGGHELRGVSQRVENYLSGTH